MAENGQIVAIGLGQKPALLVVDASHAFTDSQSPLGADFADEVATIAKAINLARARHWPIYFSTVVYRHSDDAAIFREKLPVLNMLQAGSPWVEIDKRLNRLPQDVLMEKHHASFFHGTDLHARLQAQNIDTLLIGGFTTSGCVRATAVDGLQYGYRTNIITDAVGDTHPAAHAANLSDFQRKYGDLITFSALENGGK